VKIVDVLAAKDRGREVVSIAPDAGVRDLLALLAEHNVGAVVVTSDGSTLAGIVSERDVVRHLHHDGTVVNNTVQAIMTREVEVCRPDASLDEVMETMTRRRFRHLSSFILLPLHPGEGGGQDIAHLSVPTSGILNGGEMGEHGQCPLTRRHQLRRGGVEGAEVDGKPKADAPTWLLFVHGFCFRCVAHGVSLPRTSWPGRSAIRCPAYSRPRPTGRQMPPSTQTWRA